MKKKRITYGVSGMMEYQAVIRVGRNNMKVLFTDGSVSAMGVNPATFTTENFMVQHAIENSPDFKRGRIKVVTTIELEEELRIERNSEGAAGMAGHGPENMPEDGAENMAGSEAGATAAAGMAGHGAEDGVEAGMAGHSPYNRPEGAGEQQAGMAGHGPYNMAEENTQVEFTCNDDAKDYLEQTFGYIRSKLRNREDIVSAGKAHGVSIIFV